MTEGQWPLAALPWQQAAWEQLNHALAEDRFPHALVLSGDTGIGKLQLAQALVAYLLCHRPVAGTACGECHSCNLLKAGSHADFLLLAPEDSSRLIKVDQVRQVGEFLSKTPGLGKRKLLLMSPADAMNPSAANALLKNLEEPTPETYLILVTDRISRLLPTIRSRCFELPQATPKRADSLAWLSQTVGQQALAEELLQLASDKPLQALHILEADELDRQRTLQEGLNALLDGRINPLEFPQLVSDESLEAVLGLFTERLERSIRDRAIDGDRQLGPLFGALDDMQDLRSRVVAGANPNRQLCIESSAMAFAKVLGGVSP